MEICLAHEEDAILGQVHIEIAARVRSAEVEDFYIGAAQVKHAAVGNGIERRWRLAGAR